MNAPDTPPAATPAATPPADGLIVPPPSPQEKARVEALVKAWVERQPDENPLALGVYKDPETPRWGIRLEGEDKPVTTVWLYVDQRSLAVESQFIPDPGANPHMAKDTLGCYRYLLDANARLNGLAFCMGAEAAIELRGRVALEHVTDDELDRLVGSTWQYTERHVRNAMLWAFGRSYGDPEPAPSAPSDPAAPLDAHG